MDRSEATFTRLYDELYDEVFAFCARRVGRQDAADVTADVFSTVWRRITEPIDTTHRAWVFGIARRVVLNEWRSRTRRRRLSDKASGVRESEVQQPDVVVVRRAQDERVVAALAKLSERDQELLMLSVWDELTGAEIAHVLGISQTATHQRLSRARKRFAKVLRVATPDLVRAETREEGAA